MSNGRRRVRLVPRDCVEVFEARQTLYFTSEGEAIIAWDVDKPDGSGSDDVPTHEILGVIMYAAIGLAYDRFREEESK
jgi:hypothetical protein